MPEVLLHRWNNWEGGVGHPIEEGGNGMHSANKILGLRGELRPAPVATDVTLGSGTGQHFQYFFEEPRTVAPAPSKDAGSSDTATTNAVLFWSHTVGTGENRLLLVAVATDGAGEDPVVQFGSEFLSKVLEQSTAGPTGTVWMFYLKNPASGADTITVTFGASQGVICGEAISLEDADQTGPFSNANAATAVNDAGPATCNVGSANTELVVDACLSTDTVNTLTKGANQTEWDAAGGVAAGDLRINCSYETGASTTTMSYACGAATDWATVAVAVIGAAKPTSYLYGQYGYKAGTQATVRVYKVSLGSENFGNLETGYHDLTPLKVPGQSVRYQGYWWFPMGDNQSANKLSVVGSGAVANDTLDGSRANEWGADHLANLGNQMIGAHAHSTNDAGGMRILKVDGDPEEEDDWGSAFQVGDKSERAAGLVGLAGLSFVLNIEGMYSFNKSARSRLVFEDFRAWRHIFDNIPITPWMGGLAMSHPTGLLFWEPGRRPVNIGLNADIGQSVLSPIGPTGLRGGRYHGLSAVGDFLYTIYQPDITSTTANVMVGYPREPGNPYDLVFQQLGTTTLQDTDHMLDCFVAVQGKPLSPEYVTPTLWYGNEDDLSYVVLGTTASPFRTRADTHVVEAAGDAHMSELLFEEPEKISRVVVHTQNMVAGDEWQLLVLADGNEETNFGPALKRNGRIEFTIDRHDIYRLLLHVNWATTVTTARAAPSIQRIELYGPEKPGRQPLP